MEKWLNDIHDRLKDYEQDAPQGLWDDLYAQMKRQGLTGKNHRKHPGAFLWPRRIAVAASIAAILLLSYWYAPDFGRETVLTTTSEGTIVQEHALPHENIPQPLSPASMPEKVLAQNTRKISPLTPTSYRKPTEDTTVHKAEAQSDTSEPAGNGSTTSEQQQTVAQQQVQSSRQKTERSLTAARRTQNISTTKVQSRHTGKRLTCSAYATGLSGADQSSKFMSTYPTTSLGPDNSSWNDSPQLGIAVYNQGKMIEKSIHHRLPIRVGTSFSYELNDFLAIGSGLTYTRLHSTLREGTETNYQSIVQNLHYMGIPVTLKYTFFRRKNLSLYAQGGALAEVRVAGKEEKRYILNSKKIGAETERITSHPLQMSVNLSAGIQYHLTSTLAVYAEPGISHYFQDNSSVPTIYQEKPTNFNLNLGVRIRLGK